MVTDKGKKKASTGIHAGHAPSKIPIIDPVVAVFSWVIEQQALTFLL